MQNQDSYDGLIVSIEASNGIFSLLLAVCDDDNLRDEIITQYEAELSPKIRSYSLMLPSEEPSLRLAIAKLVEQEEYLRDKGKAVLAAIPADGYNLDKFFGYLQWTREGLMEFKFPIVLWVTREVFVQMMKRSPDFYSWRKGTFHFV
jgi:hypothetical protein